ncbi:MAG: hypothetical protein V5A38_07560 [Halolamina sp.]|uniref:DUF7284 family protein n=1 Tax=Halolamina sp. TaxID=1940283 RepID=UPI002FC3C2EB
MTSVALDACLCLLLISAAGITVTSVPSQGSDLDRADSVAETLAATTATVDYSLRPVPHEKDGIDSATDDATNPEYERTAHGTLASLLARAAVRTVHVDGEALTGTNAGFAAAVHSVVRERLPPRTQVIVSFRPFPGAHLGREFRIGSPPPSDADVHAGTVHPPSGVSALANPEGTAEQTGFDGLGRRVASALVEGLFPPEKVRLALAGDAPVDRLLRHRYVRASSFYGVDTGEAIDDGDVRTANERLAEAMADRITGEFRTQFDTPADTANGLRLGTVRIAVRTWSA